MLLMRDKRQVLADWVRAERTKEGWSQSDLADRMGKVRAMVNKIERAGTDPTLDTLAALAKAFGKPLKEVLNLLGYAVDASDIAPGDPWVDEMDYKVALLPLSFRSVVDKFIDSLLEGQEDNRPAKTKPQTKPKTL